MSQNLKQGATMALLLFKIKCNKNQNLRHAKRCVLVMLSTEIKILV